ncbi:MAG: hypothetical protein ACR2IF_02760 [Terriglobales bacterium]
MSDDFFRRVADQMLDGDTAAHIAEQQRALAQNPDWAEGYYHLAQLLRVQHKRDEAKQHLLTALEKKPTLADAHVALGEIYLSESDFDRARVHAEFAAACGNPRLLEQLQRHGGMQ